MDFTKRKMSNIGGKASRMHVKERFVSDNPSIYDSKEYLDTLYKCRQLWDNMRDWRDRYMRSYRFYRGDQYSDMIYDPDAKATMTEQQYKEKMGQPILKQNIVRSLIRNVLGQYRSNPTKTVVYARQNQGNSLSDMMGGAIRTIQDINNVKGLDARLLEVASMGGLILQKLSWKHDPDRDIEDVKIQNVNPVRTFFNLASDDPRIEVNLIGEFYDAPINDVVAQFARSPKDEQTIRNIYSTSYWNNFADSGEELSSYLVENIDFFIPQKQGTARVFEVWEKHSEWRTYAHDYYDGTYKIVPYTLKEVEQINIKRIEEGVAQGLTPDEVPLIAAQRKFDHYWVVRYLSCYGHLLYEAETMYDHGEHPYIIAAYPMLNGAVWGLVEDFIDQQKYINRLVSQMDFIISTSAKGVLLIPEDVIPAGMSEQDFASEWSKSDGVITYVPSQKHTHMPQQISSNSIPAGINEMLASQIKFAYDISGIQSAIQGQKAPSGTPASLFIAESQNATLNIKDFMEWFGEFKQKRDNKIMKLARQFYKGKRMISIAGQGSIQDVQYYDADAVRNAEFDLYVTQGTDTPVYRQISEDMLKELLVAQLISIETYLENSSMPFAEKMLQGIRKEKEKMQQNGGQVTPEMIELLKNGSSEAANAANPKAMELLNRSMSPQQRQVAA